MNSSRKVSERHSKTKENGSAWKHPEMQVANSARKMDELEIDRNQNIIVQSDDEQEEDNNEEEEERKFGEYYEKYPDQLPIEYPKERSEKLSVSFVFVYIIKTLHTQTDTIEAHLLY